MLSPQECTRLDQLTAAFVHELNAWLETQTEEQAGRLAAAATALIDCLREGGDDSGYAKAVVMGLARQRVDDPHAFRELAAAILGERDDDDVRAF